MDKKLNEVTYKSPRDWFKYLDKTMAKLGCSTNPSAINSCSTAALSSKTPNG